MIDQKFQEAWESTTNTPQKRIAVKREINEDNPLQQKLKDFQNEHCIQTDNRTNELFSFVSAARGVGIDRVAVENYIINNIPIAPDSSKSDKNNLQKLINDNYNRYPIGNFFRKRYTTTASANIAANYKVDYKKEDYKQYFEKYNQYQISTNSNYPIPIPIIAINGESIATNGNIMAISGIQKSGKSSFCNIILSGCINENLDGIPPQLKIIPSEGKAIIHIDTEQAKHHQLRNLQYSILKRIGKADTPNYFYSYNIKGMEMQPAIKMLNDMLFAANEKHGGIHLVLIDGIADFVTSVNDEEQSNHIVKLLEYLATCYNTLIIAVIHRNPNDGKVRGHLGSQLLRKCEAVLAIKKEGDNSYINPEELRTAAKSDIPKYLFSYDREKGYHRYIGEEKVEVKIDKEQQLENFVKNEMEDGKEYPRAELNEILCQSMNVKEDMAEKYITRMSQKEMIIPTERGIWTKVADNIFTEETRIAIDE